MLSDNDTNQKSKEESMLKEGGGKSNSSYAAASIFNYSDLSKS
jgi:hypothetical protein